MSYSSDDQLVQRASRRLSEKKEEKKAAVPYKLTWNYMGEAGWDACGHFVSKRRWTVTTGGRSGVIVQRITRTFNLLKCQNPDEPIVANRTWVALSAGDIDTYCNNAAYRTYDNHLDYWEAWEVTASATVVGNPDTLSLCSIIPNGDTSKICYSTSGTYTISGTGIFYPGFSLAKLQNDFGFAKQSEHPAGELISRDTDPGDLGVEGYAADPFTITCTWDSAKDDAEECLTFVDEA